MNILDKNNFTFDDFSKHVLPVLSPRITQFTVPLMYKKKTRGSGVLVFVGKTYGILTASHVLHAHGGIEFDQNNIQLLQLSLLNKPNGYGIPVRELVEIKIGEPRNFEYSIAGPDLTFIRIPNQHVGSISAYKTFANLEKMYEKNENIDLNGNCVFSGFPDALMNDETTNQGSGTRVQEIFLCGVFDASNYKKRNKFDYISIDVEFTHDPRLPSNYVGISGGAVWTYDLEIRRSTETISLNNLKLAGITYYQGAESRGVRPLYCHFTESIKLAIETIRSMI